MLLATWQSFGRHIGNQRNDVHSWQQRGLYYIVYETRVENELAHLITTFQYRNIRTTMTGKRWEIRAGATTIFCHIS